MTPPHDPTTIDPARLQQWRQAIRTTTQAHYHYHMASALRRTGSPQAASHHLRQALEQVSTHARARVDLIALAREMGQEDHARALQAEGNVLDPVFTLRAEVERCEEIQEADQAEAALRRLRAPEYAQVPGEVLAVNLLRLADILTRAGRQSQAQAALRAALAAEPGNPEAHAGLAANLLRQGDIGELGTYLDGAEIAGFQSAALAFARGQYHVLCGKYGQADDAFAQAQALGHPQPDQIRLFRGRIRLATGDAAGAIEMLASPEADRVAQAYVLLARLRIGAASALVAEAETLAAGLEIGRIAWAFTLAALGRRAEALAGLDPLLESRHSYMIDLTAAILREASGEEAAARTLLRQAIERRGPFFDFFLDGLPGGREAVQRLQSDI